MSKSQNISLLERGLYSNEYEYTFLFQSPEEELTEESIIKLYFCEQ